MYLHVLFVKESCQNIGWSPPAISSTSAQAQRLTQKGLMDLCLDWAAGSGSRATNQSINTTYHVCRAGGTTWVSLTQHASTVELMQRKFRQRKLLRVLLPRSERNQYVVTCRTQPLRLTCDYVAAPTEPQSRFSRASRLVSSATPELRSIALFCEFCEPLHFFSTERRLL